jgi:uncharacterized membrane protein
MKTNPEYYKWGLFYFNREDQRIFVPKVNRLMGWTLNFARPEAYIIAAFLFLMIYLNL